MAFDYHFYDDALEHIEGELQSVEKGLRDVIQTKNALISEFGRHSELNTDTLEEMISILAALLQNIGECEQIITVIQKSANTAKDCRKRIKNTVLSPEVETLVF